MEEKKEKMTREQLEKLVNDQYRELTGLREALSRTQQSLMFRRLDYLFKVIESWDAFDEEFVLRCKEELQAAMVIPKGEEDDGGEER